MSKWNPEEIEVLTNLYEKTNIPSDSLIKDLAILNTFTNNLNQMLRVARSEKEVASKLLSLRKSSKLPRLRR